MTAYTADPAAPAVVLFDIGNIEHRYDENRGFILEFKRHVRIKIFRKEAYGYADAPIFYFNTQKISGLRASSYNMENSRLVETPIAKENIFDEKLTRSRLVRKISIPAVREGSIIEIAYTITDESTVGLPDWVFQRVDVPTVWSEFKASVPTFIEYRKVAQGWTPFTLAEETQKPEFININFFGRSGGLTNTSYARNVRVEYNTNNLHYIQENVPALKPEPFIASPKDYLARINFDVRTIYRTEIVSMGATYRLTNTSFRETNNTWERLGAEILEDVYDDVLKSSRHTAGEAEDCTTGKTGILEKMAAIYAHIGANYQILPFDHLWMNQPFENLVKNRKGTPTEINLLLINMLRQAHLKAYPVLISTRDNGRILWFRVSSDAFNRVITAVETTDSTLLLVDAAGWPNPFGLLPGSDLNGEGLLLKGPEHIKWIPVQNRVAVRSNLIANLELLPEGKLSGPVTFSDHGYAAVETRAKVRENGIQAFAQEKFSQFLADGTISNLQIQNLESWQETDIKGDLSVETSAFSTISGDKIYLSPTLGFGIRENPFKNPERQFNIDLDFPHSQTYVFAYKIPPGYSIEEEPKSLRMIFGEKALVFEYLLEPDPDFLKITLRYQVKKTQIEAVLYTDLQQFFSAMIAKLEEQVVLTRYSTTTASNPYNISRAPFTMPPVGWSGD